MSPVSGSRLEVVALADLGEVRPGSDLPALLVAAATEADGLRDGDVLVVTSKVVSKAEGRVTTGTRDDALAGETDRVVARRGPTSIVRTRHGLTMAAAGIDASNTAPGTVVLLPLDPDASARRLREAIRRLTGRDVAVVVSDTAGRAWRTGQTDIAVGAAGLEVLDDHAGRVDPYGNRLAVTAPAVADELAAAADLVKGKTSGRPAALVRGLGAHVLPGGDHGPGAATLVRPEADDLFGYGAREAVLRAVGLPEAAELPASGPDPGRGFGSAASADELAEVLRRALGPDGDIVVRPPGLELRLSTSDPRSAGRLEARVEALAFAHRWTVAWSGSPDTALLKPAGP